MDYFFPLIPCLEYFLIPVKKEILLITVRILWSDVTFLPCAHSCSSKPAPRQWRRRSASPHFRDVKVSRAALAPARPLRLQLPPLVSVWLSQIDKNIP